MAASGNTPHYSLSQFGPNDRPSWIDDYNADMRIIDTALGDGNQDEPMFCTARAGHNEDFTVSALTPYKADFFMYEGNIAMDYDTSTIPVTKSGYYSVSGVAEVYDVTLEADADADADADENDTLTLTIINHIEEDGYGYDTDITPQFFFNKSYATREIPDFNMHKLQSCSITPVIVHLDAGDAIAMKIDTYTAATVSGHISLMSLTLESKMFDDDAD